MSLFCLKVERHVLGGLLRHPKIFAEIDCFLSAEDFSEKTHRAIYSVIRSILLSGEEVADHVIVSSKLDSLGISSKGDVNIHEYIEALRFNTLTEKGALSAAKEVIKHRIKRDISDTGENLKSFVKDSGELGIDEIISKSDSIYSEKISSYDFNDTPLNVFEGISESIQERADNPIDEFGLLTPYPEFNRLYGGLRKGNLYAIVSRPAQGKTTFLNDICLSTAINNKVPVLVLDTEMPTQEIQFRMAASQTDVPLWYLETGQWKNNPEMSSKVNEFLSNLQQHKYFHYHVRNKSIDEICSIIRRWHLKEVGRGKDCIIAYDYVKLTGEKVSQNWAEHQAIGEKIDKLKKIAEEIQAPIFTAMQMNRSGEGRNRDSSNLIDDSSVISLSDRLQWYASFVAIFRRKTIDELALDGQAFGSHKLIPIKTRFQGRDATGHNDLIMRPFVEESETGVNVVSERLVSNYLSFDISNFRVTERGSLEDIIRANAGQMDITQENEDREGSITF